MRIELIRTHCSHCLLRFSEKFDNPFSHVFIFGKMFPESHGCVAMATTSCIEDTCTMQFIPIELVKEDEIVRACDRPRNETGCLRKHVIKYKNMRKSMVKFLKSRGDEIGRVNSICITKSINLL